MTRLGPGCECQPKLAPGAKTFWTMYRSEVPFVLIRACQSLVRVLASISAKVPTARLVPTTPDGGVARATPVPALASRAMVAKTTKSVRFDCMGSPWERGRAARTQTARAVEHWMARVSRLTRTGSSPGPAGWLREGWACRSGRGYLRR